MNILLRKRRAVFILFVVIASVLIYALSVSAANVCCEKTKGGQYCQYVDESQCADDAKQAYTSCEQTSYCKIGCCYSSEEGSCFRQTPKATCVYEKGTWSDSPQCEIDQCQRGCCLIGDQAFYVTEVMCKNVASEYEDVKMNFRSDIGSEQDCVALARNQDKGCCIKEDGTAVFTTRGNCEVKQGVRVANRTQKTGFYKDMLCSNDLLSTGCAKQYTTKCVGEDLYWFDSCGNQENIYSSDRAKSYNNGFVLSESKSCKAKGPGDTSCGNCDYATGTICGKDEKKRMKVGDSICVSINCKETYKDDVSLNAGTPKKNGESWCVYDSLPGRGRDAVGSRHYRHMCINGEEIVEPCKDFREEICVQGVVGEEATSLYEGLFASGDYVEAACRSNRWKGCAACNQILAEDGISESSLERAKSCCESDFKDCYWFTGNAKENAGVDYYRKHVPQCIPQVPPGLKFWSDSSSGEKSAAPTTKAESQCGLANTECKVVRERSGWSKIFNADSWDVIANEFCTTKEWVVAGNNLCKAMGDCGAYFNVLGEATYEGYINTLTDENIWFNGKSRKLKSSDLGDWEELTHPAKKGAKARSTWSRFSKLHGGAAKYIIGIGFASTSVWGAVVGGLVGGKEGIASGFTSAFNPLTTTALSYLTKTGGSFWDAGLKIGAQRFAVGSKVTAEQIGKALVAKKGNKYVLTEAAKEAYPDIAKRLEGEGLAKGELANLGKQVAEKEGLKETAKGAGEYTVSAGAGSTVMSALNTALWIYTIYSLVDVLAAQTQTRTYKIECKPWVPPAGGENCEKCNDPMKPCSEYKCRSLGASCKLVNKGTGNETCINANVNDVNSPSIKPLKEALAPPYDKIKEKSEKGMTGYEISERIKPFTLVSIGIKTDEPAQCKYSIEPRKKYDAMTLYFGSSMYEYNHAMQLSLPDLLASEKALKKTDGVYTIYIRCMDANGNKNERDYFIRFTIDPSPDLTPPSIEYTTVRNGGYVALNTTELKLGIYVNEPAECRWSIRDTGFDVMENEFECDNTPLSYSNLYANTYSCTTTLTGLGPGANKFFIRCADKKSAEHRAVMEESYVFTVHGTRNPLRIVSFEPKGDEENPYKIYETEFTIKVKTEGGADNGNAQCTWSDKEATDAAGMMLFLKTGGSAHEQTFIDHPSGKFTYYIICRDAGGNTASEKTTISVEVDNYPPMIESLYIDPLYNELHIKLDESATCEYSDTEQFSLGEGTPFQQISDTEQVASLNEMITTYYVQCQDKYKNKAKYIVHV